MKIFKLTSILFALLLIATACNTEDEVQDQPMDMPPPVETPCNDISSSETVNEVADGAFTAAFTSEPIQIDGCSKDSMWSTVEWNSLNYRWMGADPDPSDYNGQFKLLWDANYLYLFVKVEDDSLHSTLADGINNYWKGDYVELFLDEDQSGGNHQFSHQAFAYHVSTEGRPIDRNTNDEIVFFDDHINVMRIQEGTTHYWEMAISIFDDQFDENSTNNTPIPLTSQKVMGFSLAYGDNDGNQSRENFMGSRETHGVNNDEGYITADVFGTMTLID